MLRVVTGARSVGSVLQQRNQTSGGSIGPTRGNVASLYISFFNCDLRNGICVAKSPGVVISQLGDFCFRSFLSVISVTYPLSEDYQLETP
ncbi:hypothetical protein UYSO10_4360 [Kosakonia radicincitans]|nr:hypothetical protein AW40_21820 [Kosakonia radicincitans UMEnt01/12]SKC19659.1 hypothetical protein SAMN05216168_2996 [Kosakonia radicincitans]VVT52829.1 hypothetical protein UYSO10_4360 [Kosakonia radicincitans]